MGEHVLVTGASGRNGAAACARLVALGLPVRAACRHPERVPVSEVEHTRLDWDDPETHEPALRGVDRLYLIVHERLRNGPEIARAFVERALRNGVRRFVVLSALGVETAVGTPLHGVEQAVRELVPDAAFLRPNWFMDNFTGGRYHRTITEEGVIRVPAGDAEVSFVAVDDIAACAAALLAADTELPGGHLVTGPGALGFADVAAEISAASGRPVRYQPLDLDDPDLMAELGVPGADPRMARTLFSRVLSGGEAVVTDTVRALTNRPATSFPTFARQHAAAWS
ncbi:NmrA family NAD(P)-binding protein [Streptoalloteichus hindustanus]|uniref:Uncharacterized conserved protein YbjT, contains NAD(P)-binding and DUF2867 domains n=1 Tax=Streptoalloteichus hindustanus TaxID=2017 RepID=A0A1M5PPU8_STRHI|nr:NAD(P)H-binding protein [Streptoalloteichus hindustanus]SHH03778.1 Uncharacterized conserved protein YbjT, contains NAD(P)-binding and DUF2867 domains [Streptoalloteichus hindustanus]